LLAKEIGNEWTKVEIPLTLFPFEENDFDLFNVKQLIIQLFSEGVVDINSIQLVPFSRKLKEEIAVMPVLSMVQIDGNLSDWKNTIFTELDAGHKLALLYSKDTLFAAAYILDADGSDNKLKGGELWKGDAIELAFSTNSDADGKRSYYLLSDQHIGINCGVNSYCWDFKRNEEIGAIKYKISSESNGYVIEMAIPFNQLYKRTLEQGETYGFEIFVQQKLIKKLFYIVSYTFVRSKFSGANGNLIPSSWDSRHLLSATLGYKFKKGYELGLKYRFAGGTPYTPFDLEVSQQNYLLTGTGTLNTNLLNTNRLQAFNQLDVRVDKKINFKRTAIDLYIDIQNILALESQGAPQYTFKRNADNTDFETTDGNPIKADGSNGVPVILNDLSKTVVPTIGIIFEF
jgi:hypothetical protein